MRALIVPIAFRRPVCLLRKDVRRQTNRPACLLRKDARRQTNRRGGDPPRDGARWNGPLQKILRDESRWAVHRRKSRRDGGLG
ncbi:MAG: hypothetical protein K2M42_08955 [Oscillospiraceae bacterium]|nr:hypothetical protein [Oscillospiraceae bacterium]